MTSIQLHPGTVSVSGQPNVVSRVLIAEDSATARILLRHQLSALFPLAEIEDAADGKAAMRALSSSKMDLIITDLQMPGVDGLGFIKMLRHTKVLQSKPVVVVTMSPEQAGEDITSDPWIRVLSKPVREDELGRAIAELMA